MRHRVSEATESIAVGQGAAGVLRGEPGLEHTAVCTAGPCNHSARAVQVGQQQQHHTQCETRFHHGQVAEEVVHERVQAQVTHSHQHKQLVAGQSQEVAEYKGEEDPLQGGSIRETQLQEGLHCAVFSLKEENSWNVWKD